jgi:pSer/pThr/pTyr-binding forkhead associated (FHA) protein
MDITLTIIEGPQQGKQFDFSEPDTFLLGRDNVSSTAHFRLNNDDTQVSRNHFLLEINPPDSFICDAGSMNGTFIVRPGGNQVFFLSGRKDDAAEYANRAECLMKKLGYAALGKVDERLKLADQDIIHVGQTAILVEVIGSVPRRRQDEQADDDRNAYCIECGCQMPSPTPRKKVEELSIDDFICSSCQGKRRMAVVKRHVFACCTCGRDVTEQAHSDGRADELLTVALYQCGPCTDKQLSGQRTYNIATRYVLLKQLGEGGFGTVYLAQHTPTDRLVALKLTKEAIKQDERLIKRFKREIAIMQSLVHHNLVRLYDEGITAEGSYFFVSEYIPRGNLMDFCALRYGDRMPIPQACQLIGQALEGLAYNQAKSVQVASPKLHML